MRKGDRPASGGGEGNLLVTNIGQLLTLEGSSQPRTRDELGRLGVLRRAALLVREGWVDAVGPTEAVAREARGVEVLDARGGVVMPGFVDAHTHAAFAGSREAELADKLAGKSYAQIAAEGGGINRTVRQTRAADSADILKESKVRLLNILAHGTTTVEVKSGYGLDLENEMKLLKVISQAGRELPLRIVPTFLGAHAIPEEYESDPGGYMDEICERIIPKVASSGLAKYCDVFVEEGFFNQGQGRRVLMEGQRLGLASKVHADELTACGGAELAGEVSAISADHLLHSTAEGLEAMARSGTIAVLLPGTSFSTPGLPYCDARRIIEAGIPVALGTDLSPNSWVESMQFIISLACYQLRMAIEEAIAAATINSAWAVGLGEEVGSLEEGRRSDLLVLNVGDYRQIPYRIASNLVREVVIGGRVVLSRG